MGQQSRRTMDDILEEHLEELDFLWEQRERMVFAPDWTIRQLADLEERAEAHLDGLRIGEPRSVELARPLLGGERGAATAAALTLLAIGSGELAAEVMRALGEVKPGAADGIRIALRHADVSALVDRLYEMAMGSDPFRRAVAADVLAFHRLRPPPELERLLVHDDPAVQRLGWGAVGRFGRPLAARDVEQALRSDDTLVRRLALEAAARARLKETLTICRKSAAGPRRVPEAVAFLGVIGDADDVTVLRAALADAEAATAALAGLGALGVPAAVPLLLQAMARPDVAAEAGEAFVRLAGVDEIWIDAPVAAAQSANAEDDGEDDRRAPDPAKAQAIWEGLTKGHPPVQRWQAGVDVSSMPLSAALGVLPLAIRRDVYLRARLRDGDQVPDIELEARATGQTFATSRPRRPGA